MTTTRDRLATELRRLREVSGRSLKDLESDLHVSDSSLSRYLSGKTVPPWDVVSALCRVAGREPEQLQPLWTAARNEPEQNGRTVQEPAPKSRPPWLIPLICVAFGILVGGAIVPAVNAVTSRHHSDSGTRGPHFSVTLLEGRNPESSNAAIWSFNARCGNADEYRLVYDLPIPIQHRATAYRLEHSDCTVKLFDGIGGTDVGIPLTNDARVHTVPPELLRRGSSVVAYSCCNGTILPTRR
ncbi:helix-turn-helix domain-containing protein [Actinomadura rupiterrae]|uniref:helix-turn-helix domain-containing protein n=1 Tax=Actinomadura rupiterrae TaxID=559627 RepID=UPI0020A300CC|nr:helix-turn-helix transcriptional regulator [Actinomadura rupiterrae]MCP2336052.1 transcriptional regulator with XRE-family HTH domain [Actinomadura rupiterrae]